MTFFRKPTILKHSLFSKTPAWLSPALVLGFLVALHGSLFGPTDDEAYYWVLAQRPAWGYAYHPPAVAWTIRFFQEIFAPIFGDGWTFHPVSFRIPSAILVTLIAALSLKWVASVASRLGKEFHPWRSLAWVLFPGFAAASWMMVPDLPLFFGLLLVWNSTWTLCESRIFQEAPSGREKIPGPVALALTAGVALACLSKYSGVLVGFSAALAILFWAPSSVRWRGWGAIFFGLILAAVPILRWNSQHEWASLIYQLRGRHGEASWNALRYARFWFIQLVLAGPVLIGFFFWRVSRFFRESGPARGVFGFALAFAMPAAAIFLVQPAFSEFKAHWAFVVWLPLALSCAVLVNSKLWIRTHLAQVGVLGSLGWTLCHFPLIPAVVTGISPLIYPFTATKRGGIQSWDARWDVSNDLYGWDHLREFVREKGGEAALRLPVVGSRYQTAAQAAFAWKDFESVTLSPRNAGDSAEWPSLSFADSEIGKWPRLKAPVLYVADHRYSQGPEFPESDCRTLGKMETYRSRWLARWVEVWHCEPAEPHSLVR